MPGQPPSRNTRLSLVARNALKPSFGEETAASIEKQVEDGKINLAGLDELARHGDGIIKGVVTLIFGTSNVQDIALSFLSGERYDKEIAAREAGAELAMLLNSELDADLSGMSSPADGRMQFARHVLVTEFLTALNGSTPDKLSEAWT
jgi:hypothetical protein